MQAFTVWDAPGTEVPAFFGIKLWQLLLKSHYKYKFSSEKSPRWDIAKEFVTSQSSCVVSEFCGVAWVSYLRKEVWMYFWTWLGRKETGSISSGTKGDVIIHSWLCCTVTLPFLFLQKEWINLKMLIFLSLSIWISGSAHTSELLFHVLWRLRYLCSAYL